MSAYEFRVSLRIRHPTINPAKITATLGIQPQHTWRAGQPRCDAAVAVDTHPHSPLKTPVSRAN